MSGKSETHEVQFKYLKNGNFAESKNFPQIEYSVSYNGFQNFRTEYIEPSMIKYAKVSPVIDANKSDWGSCSEYTISHPESIVLGKETYKGPVDSSADFSLAWNEEALFLYADITDDDLKNDFPEEAPWTGDAVELFIDLRNKEKIGKADYDKNVFQIFCIPPDEKREKSYIKIWQPAGALWKNAECKFTLNPGKGYWFEAKLPWKDAGIENAAEGMEIGFDFVLDDFDRNDFEHVQQTWRGTPNNWRDPSGFPRLKLGGK